MGNNLQRNGNGEAIDKDLSLIRSGCIQLRLVKEENVLRSMRAS